MKHLASLGFLVLLAITSGYGAPNQSALTVGVSVLGSCSFPSANTLRFGQYDPTSNTSLTVVGAMTIQCTILTSVKSIGLDFGLHASGTQRAMQGVNSGDKLQYNITMPQGVAFGLVPSPGTCPATPGTPWTNSGAGLLVPSSGGILLATTVVVNICGQIPVPQNNVSGDSYSDQVQITVNFT